MNFNIDCSADPAAPSSAPHQFHRLVAFAGQCAADRRPYADAEEAAELLHGWSSGPAGVRASIKLDAAMEASYRAGQIERARTAMRDQWGADPDRDTSDFYNRDRLATHLIERAARDTSAPDGEFSTFITPADLVDLAAEFLPIDDREEAEWTAEQALRDYHWGWREPTFEEAAEAAETEAAMDLWLAEHANRPDPFDPTQRSVLPPGDPVREATFLESADGAPLAAIEVEIERVGTNAENLRRAADNGSSEAAFEQPDLAAQALALEHAAQESGNIGLSTALKRARLGMEPEPEPEQPEPESLKSDARLIDLCSPPGLVGDIIDWMEASSDRPNRALMLGAALTFVATLAGRKFATPSNLRTNNYMVTLAPSGHGKDHAIGRIKALAAAAGLDRYVGPARIMSASAMRKLIAREPSAACFMDEFGGFMGQIHDRRAGMHNAMIRFDLLEMFSAAGTFFAGAEYAAEAAAKVFAPNFSISGTSTPESFWSSLSSLSASDGLLARLILLDISGPKPARVKPRQSPSDVPAVLIGAVQALAGARGNLAAISSDRAPVAITVPLDTDAEAIDAEIIAELDAAEATTSPEAMPFLNRVREHALKLALVVAVGCNPNMPVITGPVLDWAYKLARLSAATLIRESADRIADNERGDAVNRILRMICAAGNAGVTAGRIADKQRGVDARLRDQILRDLVEAGRVRLDRQSGTGGRARERYIAA